MTAAALSGCDLFKGIFGRNDQPTTAPSTTVAETTAPPTEATTAPLPISTTPAPTKAEQSSQNGGGESSMQGAPDDDPTPKEYSGMVLVDNAFYTDQTLGLAFYMPEWVNKVYARSEYMGNAYSLSFYEKTNYEWGVDENGWDGMGMLFTVYASDTEATGENIEYPAGSLLVAGQRMFLTYFKPTDVRCDPSDQTRRSNYQDAYDRQFDIFKSATVLQGREYIPSTNPNHIDLADMG